LFKGKKIVSIGYQLFSIYSPHIWQNGLFLVCVLPTNIWRVFTVSWPLHIFFEKMKRICINNINLPWLSFNKHSVECIQYICMLYTIAAVSFHSFLLLRVEVTAHEWSLPSPLPLWPQQPLMCFLSLWICLFWYFISGIIRYVSYCVWLLSLWNQVFKVHPCHSKSLYFIPFYGRFKFHCWGITFCPNNVLVDILVVSTI
jgi:hypothetical protein